MRLYIWVVFVLMNTLVTGALQPLSFDQDLSGYSVEPLFKITANLFHVLKDADLLQETVQLDIANRLIDLIGGLYILRHHQQRIHFLHEDLEYLANLIHDLKLNFNNKTQSLASGYIHYITCLFIQLEAIVLTLI